MPRTSRAAASFSGGFRSALIGASLIGEDEARYGVNGKLLPSRYRYTDEEIQDALCFVARRLGRSPRPSEYQRERQQIYEELLPTGEIRTLPTMDVIRKRHGTWNAALRNAALESVEDPRMPHLGKALPSGASDVLAPLRAMTSLLPREAQAEIARALHAKLNAPPTPAERRVEGLGFLSRLLDETPQYPEHLPYVPRRVYDVRRAADASLAPPSARLQERFGSWARACHAAWGSSATGALGDQGSRGRGRRVTAETTKRTRQSRASTHALKRSDTSRPRASTTAG